MKAPVWNILPTNDVGEHTEDSTCACKPVVEVLEHGVLIVHNSFDGREAVELAKEILKTK